MFAVGGVSGLYLQVTPAGGKSWVLRVRVGDRRRDLGLGGFPTVTLAQAREKAREARAQIERGIDPVEERKAAKARLMEAQRKAVTFEKAVESYLAAKLDQFRNAKHRGQWRSTLESYALPELGKMPVDEIDTAAVLRVLSPIWQTKTETASRLRGRIEAVLSWATVSGHRKGDNPARWGGNLKELLPAPGKIANEGNHPAVALNDAARWFADLRKREGFAARALEFLALTAARSGEVREMTWDEVDFGDRPPATSATSATRGADFGGGPPATLATSATWTVPAGRMKAKREHRVPLSPAAVALLEALPRLDGSPLVFPGGRGGPLSDMTLSATMKRMHAAAVEAAGDDNPAAGYLDPRSKRPAVPHGLRSTFRDWVAERTTFPGEMAEVALAHRIPNAVEAAYRRGDMVEKRRRMMAAWAGFLEGRQAGGDVVRFA